MRCNFIKSHQLQVSKHFLGHGKLQLYTAISEEHLKNETPTVRGLAADNNNMQSVLMGNMETI